MACKTRIPRRRTTRVLHSTGEDKKHEPYRLAGFLNSKGIKATVRITSHDFDADSTYDLVVPVSDYNRAKKLVFI